MAKKKKRRIQAPSLSSLDKGIYCVLIVVFVILGIFLYPLLFNKFYDSVFLNKRILAINSPGMVLTIFGLFLGGGLAGLVYWLMHKKQPIFGKGTITYGPPQWKPVYPLFSKQFWSFAFKDKKRMAVVLIATTLIVVILISVTALGLQPRECLLDDGGILVYNCLGQNVATYNASDVVLVRIYTRMFASGRSHRDDWGIEMAIKMRNGECFYFGTNNAWSYTADLPGHIAGMNHIKSCYDPNIVVLEGQDDLQKVIEYRHLDQQQIDLLHELFDIGK
jgi:hypothetical protein